MEDWGNCYGGSDPLSTSQGNAAGDRTHRNGNDSLSPGSTTHYLDSFGTSQSIFLSLSVSSSVKWVHVQLLRIIP